MWGKLAIVVLLYYFLPWSRFLWAIAGLFVAASIWTAGGGKNMHLRRKIAISTWKPQKDSAMTAVVSFDMTNAQAFIAKHQANGIKLSPTVLFGKAIAHSLETIPHVNGRIIWGRFVPRDTVDICFLVAVKDSKNLGYTTLRNVPKMSLKQIADAVGRNAENVRTGKDPNFKQNMDVAKMLPTFIMGPLFAFLGFIANCIGVTWLKPLGVDPHAFGSFVITSIGAFGFEEATAPLTPWSHNPGIATVCAIKQQPVVLENGKIEARPIMKVAFTVDHRYLDAYEASIFRQKLEQLIANPELMQLE